MLAHLPSRYQDRSQVTPIAHVRAGDEYLVEGQIQSCNVIFGGRRSLKVTLRDRSGQASMRLFHFSKYQQRALTEGTFIRLFGRAAFFGRELTFAHPEYETSTQPFDQIEDKLTPVYPTTAGITQGRWRKLAEQLQHLDLPDEAGLPYRDMAFLHSPPASATLQDIEDTQAKVAYDELTAYYIVMQGRARQRQTASAYALPQREGKGRQLLDALGFRLTKAQANVTREVLEDLTQSIPMLRLVQGDVGSGKTVIAAFAAIRAAENNCQTAYMAPTELLAEQHATNFNNWLQPLGLNVVLVTGGMGARSYRECLAQIASGAADVVIGTHAIFQDKVEFAKLGLTIIDEQHRFGVHQRMALKSKTAGALEPHQLVMTATPIPRTLTMALYADMEVSVIDELPKGRQPITTELAKQADRHKTVQRIHQAIKQGQQAYWVCTLIEPSEEISATSAEEAFADLQSALPDCRIGLLHGRMKSAEKNSVMASFKAGDIQLLVATTVIEVGVDVPNATCMVIENAERLGLAQLHQLRGRIGRGSLASYCFLHHADRLSEAGEVRLSAMRDTQDGFVLAEQDLKLRGPGDILGTRQSGEEGFRIADIGVHAELMSRAVQRGKALIDQAEQQQSAHLEMSNLLQTWAPADRGLLSV